MFALNAKNRKIIISFLLILGLACLLLSYAYKDHGNINNQMIFGLWGSNAVYFLLAPIALVVLFFLVPNLYFFRWLIIIALCSNLLDRIVYGGVVDYISIINLNFNLPDLLIVFAIAALFYQQIEKTPA